MFRCSPGSPRTADVLTASFRHIRGIGAMRERQLWMRGVSSWDALPEADILAPRLDELLRAGVAESRGRLAAGDLDFFARALPETEHWRLLPHVLDDAGFVDIETADDVTVIGILDREGPRSFVRGRDLEQFPVRAARWRAVVTFNGTAFDLPHLRKLFPGWQPPAAHVDLSILLRRLGEAVGLKQSEPRVRLHRPPDLAPLSATDAVWLWRAQRRRDPALERRLDEVREELGEVRSQVDAGPRETVFAPRPPRAAPSSVDRPLRGGPSPTKPRVSLEVVVGRYGMLALAAVLVLAAAGMFLSWAAARGWLGPSVRVALGLAGAAGLSLWGIRVRPRHRPFGDALLGIALATAHVCAWAAGPGLRLVPPPVALAFSAVASVGLAAFALRER